MSAAGPLDGLRVLDLSRFIAGPFCGMLLGDLGADVVKVERPGSGDEARGLGPRVGGESLYVMVFNRNKRSLTLNLRTIGILAALERRHATGQGQIVDLSLLDSATSLLVTAIPEHLLLGRSPTRLGNRDRYAAPAQTFRARDGTWVHLVGGSDAHFLRLARAMKREDLLADPDFDTLEARVRNIDRVERLVGEWIGGMTADAAVETLARAEVPAAKVATLADVVANPQLRHREQIVEVDHPSAGRVPMQGVTIRLSESPASIRRPAPRLGEHTDQVLGEWLALPADRIAELRSLGVLDGRLTTWHGCYTRLYEQGEPR